MLKHDTWYRLVQEDRFMILYTPRTLVGKFIGLESIDGVTFLSFELDNGNRATILEYNWTIKELSKLEELLW